MARARDPNRIKAKEMYLASDGEMLLKNIAAELVKSDSQIRKWKNQDKWDEQLKGNVTNKSNGSVTNEKETQNQESQRERSGNPNPKNQFSHRNNPKWLHGLRSKFFNQEQIEIIEAFANESLANKLWIQLEIKFSAIIRMQKIMWVESENSHLDEISLSARGEGGLTTGYRVVYAHERYESYIKAQARAMAEYRKLVDSFLKHAGEDDERRLKLEQMQLSIDKTKAEIEKLNSDGQQQQIEIKIVRKKSE